MVEMLAVVVRLRWDERYEAGEGGADKSLVGVLDSPLSIGLGDSPSLVKFSTVGGCEGVNDFADPPIMDNSKARCGRIPDTGLLDDWKFEISAEEPPCVIKPSGAWCKTRGPLFS